MATGDPGTRGYGEVPGGEEVVARPPAVAMDESDDSLYREALGGHGGVVQTEHRSHVSEACGWWVSRRVRPKIPPWW
jgi:hypothetical protein